MKDFDSERANRPRRTVEERTFQLGGEVFVARDRFRPDVLVPIENLEEAEFDPTTCRCSHRLHEHPSGKCVAVGCRCEAMRPKLVKAGSTLEQQLAAMDKSIVDMIEPGLPAEAEADAATRYRRVREVTDDPLEIEDLMAVSRWMTAGDAGRPTGGPGASTPGPEPTGTPSTGDSSSPPVAETA